jgi:hypothetical protein
MKLSILSIGLIAFLLQQLEVTQGSYVLLKVCTRLNQHRPMQITIHDNLLFSVSGYCSDCPSYMIIHGWGSEETFGWMTPLKDELFRINRNINVFLIDWSLGSDTITLGSQDLFGYEAAIRNMNSTVREISMYFKEFVKRGYIGRLSQEKVNIHCIGHSLGAHLCGLVGKLMQTNRAKFARITGLDPAGPCFDAYTEANRLFINDADFVDVIHTSMTFGYRNRLGHADFYPHNGLFLFAIIFHKINLIPRLLLVLKAWNNLDAISPIGLVK